MYSLLVKDVHPFFYFAANSQISDMTSDFPSRFHPFQCSRGEIHCESAGNVKVTHADFALDSQWICNQIHRIGM